MSQSVAETCARSNSHAKCPVAAASAASGINVRILVSAVSERKKSINQAAARRPVPAPVPVEAAPIGLTAVR